MNRSFLGSVALAAILVGPATAADMTVSGQFAPQAFGWTGFYVGAHAGPGWGHQDDNQSTLFPVTQPLPAAVVTPPTINAPASPDRLSLGGGAGGAHAGYNYQSGQYVFGVEGDVDFADLNASGTGLYLGSTVFRKLEWRSDWQGSARLRAGYARDNLLLYVTGGIAFANAKLSTGGANSSNTHVGWTAGIGADYAFSANWVGRVEARFTDFQKKSYWTIDGPVDSDWNQTTVTAGISYKF
jgi:outer membrane immunogenic protein